MDPDSVPEMLYEAYKKTSNVAIPLSACLIPGSKKSLNVESIWRSTDLARLEYTKTTRNDICSNSQPICVISSTGQDTNNVLMTAYSNSGSRKAVLREIMKNGQTAQLIEIWSMSKKIATFEPSKANIHGKIYSDGFFSAFSWNHPEDEIMFVAEKWQLKRSSYFESPKQLPLWFSEKDFMDDWGEGYEGYCQSVICTMNADNGDVRILPICLGAEKFPCQPVWMPTGNEILFSCIDYTPFKLGIKHCTNRKSQVCRYNIQHCSTRFLSSGTSCAWSPRVSPDSKIIVYLENDTNGPHRSCSKLMKHTAESIVVVDLVFSCSDGDFPGIYADYLPMRCFSQNGQFIFFSSVWRSSQAIICVNLHTHELLKVHVAEEVQSCKVLDVKNDIIVASASAPNIEPYLLIGHMEYSDDSIQVSWSKLEEGNLLNYLTIEKRVLFPVNENIHFPGLDYEVILLKPTGNHTYPSLIIHPHGGPHTSFIGEYCDYLAAFVKVGFAICLVNYRGSLGFGQTNINSLLGNIGLQDVEDVNDALEMLKNDDAYKKSRVFLFGGSHGGFICAHLNCKLREKIDACVLRNPVIDVAGMSESTDLPDWTFVESGLYFDYSQPNGDDLKHMWNLSPIECVDKVITPTLLLLGKKDRRVPHHQGLKYYHALKASGVPVNVILYEDDHALSSLASQSDMFMQAGLWFFKYRNTVAEEAL